MVGIQQDSPLESWDKRVEYHINKNKTVQKNRRDLMKERLRYIKGTRNQKSK